MGNRIVFDVEIAKTVEQAGGWDSTHKMGIGVAAVWFVEQQRFQLFGQKQIEELRSVILAADEIAGFNIWSFDLPVIFETPRAEFTQSDIAKRLAPAVYDIYRLICVGGVSKGWTLDSVSKGTLGKQSWGGKSANGAEAPEMFQRGEIVELSNYCMTDVALERDAIDFAKRQGYVLNAAGIRRTIPEQDTELLDFAKA